MCLRLPAEWEPQDGILISWPHPESDWKEMLEQVEPVFLEIAGAASRFTRVIIIGPDPSGVADKLVNHGVSIDNIHLLNIPTNDTWIRDFGPISVYKNEQAIPLDFQFNGWGNKFPFELDNRINAELDNQGLFSARAAIQYDMVLEGGSIESDGNGNLLTTSRCLLHPNRNPEKNRVEIEKILREALGVNNILWLNSGFLIGDDTDSHIDILARFAPGKTILHVACEDRNDPHYAELMTMRSELEGFRTRNDRPYRLLPLPLPSPQTDEEGNRLAATYANFLVINNAVLVPVYDDGNDAVACDIITSAFPNREIVPINCLPLVKQGGSLHCSTMQLPKGVLA